MYEERRMPRQGSQHTLTVRISAKNASRSIRAAHRSADADEPSPGGRKAGGHQHVMRMIAERTAVAAHISTQRANLVIARGIEKAGEDEEHRGSKVHHRLSPRVVVSMLRASVCSRA